MSEITGTPVIPKDNNLTRAQENWQKVMAFLRKKWQMTTFEVFFGIWFFVLIGIVNALLAVSVAGVISAAIWLMYHRGIEG